MSRYKVKVWGGGVYVVAAANGAAAKRAVCKMLGRTASAPLIGVKGMQAEKIKGE